VHSTKKINVKKGYFEIKINLTKAYDMLDWRFIDNILKEVYFPLDIIQIIMNAVTND